ncbi:MAG: hypothetical protein ACD_58C00139G0004 [uncultured bacterium]|nr:MAG: hypothetical protein ACD_58C00139G0004 [uncultured bacterium]
MYNKHMRVSYSALSSFNQCPLKYKWQYIDRIKVPTTPDLFFGSLVHSVLEFALKSGQIQPLEKSLEYYKRNWKSDVYVSCPSSHSELVSESNEIPNQVRDDNKNIELESYNAGIEMIKNFYLSHQPDQVTILSTEKFFEIYWKEHKIVGKIDRIDKLPTGEIEIIDYKTNKKLPCDDDFIYDYQLPLYAWAAKTMFCNGSSGHPELACPEYSRGVSGSNNEIPNQVRNDNVSCPPIKLTFYYLRFNKKIDPPNTKTLKELQSYILDTIYKIQASDFLPKTSPLCGWCEYLHMCPEGQEFVSNKAAHSTSSGQVSNKAISKKNDYSSNASEKPALSTPEGFINSSQPINTSILNNKKTKTIKINPDQQSLF